MLKDLPKSYKSWKQLYEHIIRKQPNLGKKETIYVFDSVTRIHDEVAEGKSFKTNLQEIEENVFKEMYNDMFTLNELKTIIMSLKYIHGMYDKSLPTSPEELIKKVYSKILKEEN